MAQHYSDPSRESDPHALPNIETFYWSPADAREQAERASGDMTEPGWYYWYCLPGCLPDSDPIGPFDTEQEALDDARENV